MSNAVERGPCHVCGDMHPIDGEQAVERFGEVLCRDCADEPVAFTAKCTNQFCQWSVRVEEVEYNRGHAKQRIRQEANSHERRKRVFDEDPTHTTEVREVDSIAE